MLLLLPIFAGVGSFPSYSETLPTLPSQEFKVTVKRFKFVGNTIFSQDELASLLKAFIEKSLSWSDLLTARAVITDFYVSKGYVTSGAYLPPQEINDGTVTINVVEGSLSDIQVQGLKRLNVNYIRDRLFQAAGEPLNLNNLLKGLQKLQLNPLIDRISAELIAAGAGKSSLKVEVQEASSFDGNINLDNSRSPAIGQFQRSLELSEGNLFGFGDRLSAVYKNTDGSNEVQLGYSFPINADNTSVSFEYTNSSAWVIEPLFKHLNLTSFLNRYRFSIRHPLRETPNSELALGLTAERQESQNYLLSTPFPLSLGASETGKIKLTTLRFFQEYQNRSNLEVLSARSEFSFGLDAFNATTDRANFSPEYFIWRAQLQWLKLLDVDTLFLARFNLQLSSDSVVSIEQFGLGGADSVRGYNLDSLLRDNGISASVEWRLPIFQQPRQNIVLQIVPFVDFATGWSYSSQVKHETNTLVSTGLGMRYQMGDNFNLRLDFGIPLVKLKGNDDNPIFFSVFYQF